VRVGTFAHRLLAWTCWGVLAVWPLADLRAQADVDLDPTKIDVHGFVSQGFILSSKNNYLAYSKRGSPEFTEVGLNFTKSFTDDIRIGVQLFARDLGPHGNYVPQVDWLYLDYRLRDWLGFRAGRTKIPFGLYNEQNDVDAARVPIMLPQAVYDIQNRSILLAQTGAELYGNVKLAAAGELEYRLYGGTIFADAAATPNPAVSVTKFDVPFVYGGRVMWLTPLSGLQAGFSGQVMRFDVDYQFSREFLALLPALPPGFSGKVPTKLDLKLWVASIEYAAYDWQLAAEYGRWTGDIDSEVPSFFPSSHTVNERYYVLAAYHLTSWLTPAAYYSGLYRDVHQREGKQNFQHDFAATLRFDLTAHWLIKVEGHFMHGTFGLNDSRDLNDKDLEHLAKNWTVLMLKTTGYF
jgi:hypothetical protein